MFKRAADACCASFERSWTTESLIEFYMTHNNITEHNWNAWFRQHTTLFAPITCLPWKYIILKMQLFERKSYNRMHAKTSAFSWKTEL